MLAMWKRVMCPKRRVGVEYGTVVGINSFDSELQPACPVRAMLDSRRKVLEVFPWGVKRESLLVLDVGNQSPVQVEP